MGDIESIPDEYQHYWPLISECPLPDNSSWSRRMRVPSEIGKVGYLTIHEGFVAEGIAQRRSGIHVDMPCLIYTLIHNN